MMAITLLRVILKCTLAPCQVRAKPSHPALTANFAKCLMSALQLGWALSPAHLRLLRWKTTDSLNISKPAR